jgi:outer membrane protein assembly factor BamB
MRTQTIVPILVLLCSPAAALANDWAEMGSDGTRSRNSSESSGPSFAPSWTYAVRSGQIVATPVSVDGMMVIAGTAGEVSVLDVRDGTKVWSRDLPGGIGSTPAVSRGHIAVATL